MQAGYEPVLAVIGLYVRIVRRVVVDVVVMPIGRGYPVSTEHLSSDHLPLATVAAASSRGAPVLAPNERDIEVRMGRAVSGLVEYEVGAGRYSAWSRLLRRHRGTP